MEQRTVKWRENKLSVYGNRGQSKILEIDAVHFFQKILENQIWTQKMGNLAQDDCENIQRLWFQGQSRLRFDVFSGRFNWLEQKIFSKYLVFYNLRKMQMIMSLHYDQLFTIKSRNLLFLPIVDFRENIRFRLEQTWIRIKPAIRENDGTHLIILMAYRKHSISWERESSFITEQYISKEEV